jgi:hypothetical protein
MGMIPRMALLGILAALGGCCCNLPRERPPLPAAINVTEQSRRLTEWSSKLPRIKATTVLGGVRMEYRDDSGRDHGLNAEGFLQIQQHPAVSAQSFERPADVLLLGKSFDQPAFEAGRNANNWWFAVKIDRKEAWIGDATRPLRTESLGAEGSASILRADLVPDLLGLSPLPVAEPEVGATRQSPGNLLYLVDDPTGTNRLFILGELRVMAPNATLQRPIVRREIVVDRYTGHISEVRLYNVEGVVVVRSELSDYAPVTYADGVAKPVAVPEFPHKVVVKYPGRYLTVALTFDDVEIAAEFKPAVFTMPKFEGFKTYAGD